MTGRDNCDSKDPLDCNIQIIGRNVLVTPAMKQYAMDKLAKIERFQNHIMDIHVTMDIEHLDHTVTLIIKFDHFKIKSGAKTKDMYASVDLAISRFQEQLRRWKDRMQDHGKKKKEMTDMEVSLLERPYSDLDEFNSEIIEESSKKTEVFSIGEITGRKTILLKELNKEEAVMKMELSSDNFLLYRSEEDKKLKVIYRRKDGSYGIIQPE